MNSRPPTSSPSGELEGAVGGSSLPPLGELEGAGFLLNCEADGLACILDRRHGDGEGVGRLAERHFMAAAQQADPLDALAVHLGRLAAERLHTVF